MLLTVASFLLFLTLLPSALIIEGLSKEPEGCGYANEREINEITVGEGIIFMNGTANHLGSLFLNHPLNLPHLLCRRPIPQQFKERQTSCKITVIPRPMGKP